MNVNPNLNAMIYKRLSFSNDNNEFIMEQSKSNGITAILTIACFASTFI
jgi:hypothetical protein